MSSPDADIRRKRLLFRAWHRGTREADLILGSFAEAHLDAFDAAQLDRFEALLECPDAARADYLVTGNLRHFSKFWKKNKIITSRELIGIMAPHSVP